MILGGWNWLLVEDSFVTFVGRYIGKYVKASKHAILQKFEHVSKLGVPYLPSMDKNKFEQVLYFLHPRSLDILKTKFAPKHIFSQFCKDSIG